MSLTVSYTVPESKVLNCAQYIFDELDYLYGGDAIDIANLNEKEFVEGLANYPKFRSALATEFRENGTAEILVGDFVDTVQQFSEMKYIASLLKEAHQIVSDSYDDEHSDTIATARKVLKKAGYRVVKC